MDGAGVGLGGGVTVKLELMAGTATGLTPTGHSSPPHSHPPPLSSSAQWLKMAGLVHSQLVAVVSPLAYTGAARQQLGLSCSDSSVFKLEHR